MKRFLFVLITVLLALTACAPKESAPTQDPSISQEQGGSAYRAITPQEAKGLLDSGASFILVDVRTAAEYEEGHIPSAVSIANEDIGTTPPEALPDQDTPVVVYCRSGRRSREAAEKLLAMGYTQVMDLGGIQDWPYATVAGAEPGTWTVEEETPAGILSSFATMDLDGNTVDQTILSDSQLTMVNVWATYCGPCLQEMPELGELAAEYQEKQVQIVGLVTDVLNSDGSLSDSQMETARKVVSSTQADYLHVVPTQDLYGVLSQVSAVPTTFFVDKDGNQVGKVYIGSRSKADWAGIIDTTLAEVM